MKMRRVVLAAACAVTTLSPGSGAATYTIDFAAVAGDAGRVITTSFDEGPFRVQLNAVRVIGPGDPYYSGTIGIVATLDQFDVVIDPIGSPFLLESISGTFAAEVGRAYEWHGVADVDERGPMWSWSGSAPQVSAFTPAPPVQIDRAWLTQISGTTAQMTGIAVEAVLAPPPTPEPGSIVMLAIGAVAIVARARRTIAVAGTSSRRY